MMRRLRITRLYLFLCLLFVTLAAGCGGTPEEGTVSVGVSAQALSAADVTKLTVTISGGGISPDIVQDLVQSNGQWGGIIGGIPAGSNRTVLADAYDAGNTKIYTGQVSGVTVTSGGTAAVVIVLQDQAAPTPFFNSAPRITGLVASASQVEPGAPVALTLAAVDADGDPLAYAWTASGGSFANGTTAAPTWTAPGAEGDYPLSVSVTDGKGGQAGISLTIAAFSDSGDVAVSVLFNTWPTVTSVTATPGQVDTGATTALNVVAVDGDSDPLGYAWSDGGCGGSFSDAAVQSPTWTAPAAVPPGGACSLVVSVSDGQGGSTTGTLVVSIGLPLVPNALPVIDQTFQSLATVAPGGSVLFQVDAHDPEGTALAFAWSAGDGALGIPLTSGNTSQVSWTAPGSGGPFAIKVKVTDALGAETTETFDVTLSGAAAPVVVVAGDSHSMLLKSDGTLWATGWNFYGQLGDGTTIDRHGFTQVLSGVASVSAGAIHTMAVKTDGTLWATGFNDYGELGDGTTTSSLVFVQVLTGVASAVAADAHSLALKTDGTLWGTGYNGDGELGDGTTIDRHGFVQVASGIASIDARWDHSLALTTGGTLLATGYNADGELGDGTTTSSLVFVPVLTGVASCSGGYSHSLAVKTDGTLWATGANTRGELGDGSNSDSLVFVQVASGVTGASAGGNHSVALGTGGAVRSTGANDFGQLGDGSLAEKNAFAQVATGALRISTGYIHTMVVNGDGTLWATGNNSYGQLGDGTTNDSLVFVQVPVP